MLKISIVLLHFPKMGDFQPKISYFRKNIFRRAKIHTVGEKVIGPPARTPLAYRYGI